MERAIFLLVMLIVYGREGFFNRAAKPQRAHKRTHENLGPKGMSLKPLYVPARVRIKLSII